MSIFGLYFSQVLNQDLLVWLSQQQIAVAIVIYTIFKPNSQAEDDSNGKSNHDSLVINEMELDGVIAAQHSVVDTGNVYVWVEADYGLIPSEYVSK